MSRSLRLLNTPSLRAATRSIAAPTTTASRKCLHSVPCLQARMRIYRRYSMNSPCRSAHSFAAGMEGRESAEEVTREEDEEEHHDGDYTSGRASQESTEHLTEHLNGLLSPLEFPPELARRILTHSSHPAAVDGHNAALTFMGRRVLESYLYLFLNSSPSLLPSHDFELIATKALNTYVLGEHIGSKWGLGRILRWTPTVSAQKLRNVKSQQEQSVLLRKVGLYKVQGDAVEAVVGGVFNQFGASCAHRLFHTRILPNLLLPHQPHGLIDVFHADAKRICQKMGGTDGPLLQTDSSIPNAGGRLDSLSFGVKPQLKQVQVEMMQQNTNPEPIRRVAVA